MSQCACLLFFLSPLLLLLAGAAYFFAPLLFPHKPALFILQFSKIGTPAKHDPQKNIWISPRKLERFFISLHKRHITPVLPQKVNQCAEKSSLVLLFFAYQSFFTLVYPLLEKYNLKAGVILPPDLIGQYDAWQKETDGPWQNLLTAEQIKFLQKSGRVEFLSTSLDGRKLSEQEKDAALTQISESKNRLEKLHKLPISAFYFPDDSTPKTDWIATAEKQYSCLISAQRGNNILSTQQEVLHTQPFQKTCLTRLIWKINKK